MNTKDLRMEQVYICSDGQKTAHNLYLYLKIRDVSVTFLLENLHP